MKKISAKIVADSVDSRGNRITSYILTYPRFIHAEVMTHRMFSRNAASSRAIPFKTMLKTVKEDPFVPIAWQKEHKGMQGTEYIDDPRGELESSWRVAANSAAYEASALHDRGVTKQLCNRILEPYLWYTCLVTATEYDNFFELRCPKYDIGDGSTHRSKKDAIKYMQSKDIDTEIGELFGVSDLDWIKSSRSGAEIHIQVLAEAMWDAKNESCSQQLEPGEWHIPFKDQIDQFKLLDAVCNSTQVFRSTENKEMKLGRLKVGVARAARLSYMTFGGEIDYAKDIALHGMLLESRHMSPFEHVAQCMTKNEYLSSIRGRVEIEMQMDGKGTPTFDKYSVDGDDVGWCNNFRGFIPYRYLVENG